MEGGYPDAKSFASALAETGLSDKELSVLLHVNQSTVSRLRAAKTANVGRYVALLQARGLLGVDASNQLDQALSGLGTVARRMPALANLLCILHGLVVGKR